MRKTAILILTGLMTVCGHAQSAYDALLFSENDYEGSARTMAMGNAFTALGGDLGSIGLNPAGSAVAGYSTITFTPGLTFSASTTQGVSPYENGYMPYFEREIKNKTTDFSMPNLGFMFNFDTHRNSGLKNFTFGFVANKTAGWDEDLYANGTNETTSFMGEMAWRATFDGMAGADLNAGDAYDFMPWDCIVGYRSGMISTFGETGGESGDQFAGASEIPYDNGTVELAGALEQTYGRRVQGSKYDYVLNFGANFSDFIYFGFNFGITTLDYSEKWYFKESAIDPSLFEIGLTSGETIHFHEMRYTDQYRASGVGYYGKFGVIVTPGFGLRLGAAVQTPTINVIDEEWRNEGATYYDDRKFDASEASPWGEYTYKLSSPFRANFGLAYAFRYGVVSADYELCDYSQMKFKPVYGEMDEFMDTNEDIMNSFRRSDSFRFGLEARPLPQLSLRAGYGFTKSAEKYVYEAKDASTIRTQNISFGIGYSSKNSFFADLAVRQVLPNDEYIIPYDDYIFEYDENGDYITDQDGYFIVQDGGYTPQLKDTRVLWKVALTLGWRF